MSIPVITGPPDVWPLPATRCIFRGHLMDYETAAFLMAMEAGLGYELTVVQGCYNPGGVAASGGTHDGGGVFDLAPWDWENKVKVARELGGFSWHRLPSQGPWPEHIHTGIRNHPTLSNAAKVQQKQFDANPRHNGLANNLVDPDQSPKRPTPTFHYPPKAPPSATFRGITLNDDWGNLASDVAGVVADYRPLVMGVQEAWRVHYKDVVDPRFHVTQLLENDSTAGVAVIHDRRRLLKLGATPRILANGDPSVLGAGWQAIGKGKDTRVRGVVWRDVAFRPPVDHGALPGRFRLASVHRPPMRNRKSWDSFDAVLALWMKRSPLPVVLFMDCNEHGGPEPLGSSLPSPYAWHGVDRGIDGAITSLPVRGTKALPERTSDHAPVLVQLG